MKPKIIKTEAEYEQALARLDAIFDAKPGTSAGDEAELLSVLIEMYEDRFYPIEPPTPVEAIRFRMDQLGLRQKDLIPMLGSASKVSEVLSGKRSLSLAMIKSLVHGLNMPADVLIQRQSAGKLSVNKLNQNSALPHLMKGGRLVKVH